MSLEAELFDVAEQAIQVLRRSTPSLLARVVDWRRR
jgi:hypothetical protein